MVKETSNLGQTCAHAMFGKRCAVITNCTVIAHCQDIHILVPLPIVFCNVFPKVFLGFYTYFNYFEACSDKKIRLDFV